MLIPQVNQGTTTQVSRSVCQKEPPWQFEVLSLNINAWPPFKHKWMEAGGFDEFPAESEICLQEHRLVTQAERDDAREWLRKQGWDVAL